MSASVSRRVVLRLFSIGAFAPSFAAVAFFLVFCSTKSGFAQLRCVG